ncbi:septation protein SepH [Microbacterium sp. SL62]|uniref:septation protein SepH n=1 Tax=Microbacterium sp. SL62 TaxID=2995139 RepID=UPI002275AA72|nr:septation protein SepH [Microbacterium sp. SL62]MCY1717272.1 septation protein SepH [Microbacterium sp. SL62]
MEQLKVIGTEDDVLVVATQAGERFALALDEVLRAEARRARRDREDDDRAPRPSPREIQAHIRAGLSAREVATLLNARVEDVERFEGPVLAEREHVVAQALAVPVLLGGTLEHDSPITFGAAVRAKLAEAGASAERWTSWKESSGWSVKLEFTANGIDHDARWSFDPRRSILSPQNADAIQLSRQGSLPEGLIPRLRALDNVSKDDSRFDSGAFGPRRIDIDDEPGVEATGPVAAAVQAAAIKRAPDAPVTSAETADLLEALRRRRGQREPLPGATEIEPEPRPSSSAPVALFDAVEPGYADDVDESAGEPERPSSDNGRRTKGRPSMPSWDEIVFGARSDES